LAINGREQSGRLKHDAILTHHFSSRDRSGQNQNKIKQKRVSAPTPDAEGNN
jgi:hypothetical protein